MQRRSARQVVVQARVQGVVRRLLVGGHRLSDQKRARRWRMYQLLSASMYGGTVSYAPGRSNASSRCWRFRSISRVLARM